jgi:DNA-binding response OmpR family regulator
MEETHQLRGRVLFGVFELDLRAGELRKDSLRVRLQEQPFQVLAMLLEHPGEVVTPDGVSRRLETACLEPPVLGHSLIGCPSA